MRRDRSRFHPGAHVVTVSYSVCWPCDGGIRQGMFWLCDCLDTSCRCQLIASITIMVNHYMYTPMTSFGENTPRRLRKSKHSRRQIKKYILICQNTVRYFAICLHTSPRLTEFQCIGYGNLSVSTPFDKQSYRAHNMHLYGLRQVVCHCPEIHMHNTQHETAI